MSLFDIVTAEIVIYCESKSMWTCFVTEDNMKSWPL
jgi:hypothetical protein